MFLRSLVVALVTLTSAAGMASAQTGLKDSVVINNPTKIAISYDIKVDGGAWQAMLLLPGQSITHSIPVRDLVDAAIPPLVQVRFMDLKPHVYMAHVTVGTTVVPAASKLGRPYAFHTMGGHLYLAPR